MKLCLCSQEYVLLSSTVVVVLVLVVTMAEVSADQQAILPYRCQVDGCAEGGTCNYETGKCSCPDDGNLYNYNCAAYAVTGDCDGCNTEGLAYPDADEKCRSDETGSCMCAEGYSDHPVQCLHRRISFLCDFIENDPPVLLFHIDAYVYGSVSWYAAASFKDSASFHTTCRSAADDFTGVVYTEGNNNGDCEEMMIDGGELYTYVYFQHNPLYRSQYDHLIKVTCFDGVRKDSPSWDIAVNDPTTTSLEPLESTIDTGTLTDTTMQLMEDNGGSYQVISTNTIDIGQDLSLVLTNISPFVVRSCTASNYPYGSVEDDYKELDLIDDGCVPADYAPLIRNVEHGYGNDNNGADSGTVLFRLDFDAFSIIGPSRNLHMRCVLCFNHCTLQSVPVCTNDFTSYGSQMELAFPPARRRRDVSNDVISSRHRRAIDGFTRDSMEVSIQIGSATDQNNSAIQVSGFDNVNGCYKSTSVLLPLSLLTVLLLVAMVMAFYFCTKLTTGNRAKTVNDHVTHKS